MAALAHAGYYDGVTFHRIIRDVIVQGGDPTGTIVSLIYSFFDFCANTY